MKNKTIYILIAILSVAVAVALTWTVLSPQFKNPLLYPKVDFENGAVGTIFLLSLPLIGALGLLIISIFLFKTKDKGYVIIAIILLVTFIPMLICGYIIQTPLLTDNIWCSTTDEIKRLDGFVEDKLKFETLDADDLIFFYEDGEIIYYSYKYCPLYGVEEFEISLSVKLSDEKFDEAVALLQKETAFKQSGDGNVGSFIVDDYYFYSRNWEGSVIEYNNDENKITLYFSFVRIFS